MRSRADTVTLKGGSSLSTIQKGAWSNSVEDLKSLASWYTKMETLHIENGLPTLYGRTS